MHVATAAFGTARMAVGATSWFAPTLTARICGFDPDATHPVMTQLFGARDFALGALTATAPPRTRASLLRLGVAIDAADAVASLGQARAGRLTPQAKLLVGAGAALFAALGAALVAADA